MTTEQLYTEIAGGQDDAFEWVTIWGNHVHMVDDIVDGDTRDAGSVMKAFINCHGLFNHPFYVKNADRLYPIIFLAGVAYSDSCKFKDDSQLGAVADVLRSYGNEVLLLVAAICTPEGENTWERVMRLSEIIRRKSYNEQH
jgi:hypothetical protein